MTAPFDVAIIGAGPAGMAAAVMARKQGLSCVVFDEAGRPGGQIYRAVTERPERDRQDILGPDYYAGLDLVEAFQRSGAEHRAGTMVWSIAEGEIHWRSRSGSGVTFARRIVAAAGAMERPFPLRGWTLPGVMTAGAAQILLKSAGLVEDDIVFVGCGPLLYLVAAQYCRAGHPPRLVIETTPRRNLGAALPHLPRALLAARYLFKGLGLIRELRAAGVRIERGVEQVELEGEDAIRGVRWRSGGRWQRADTGRVALHQGVVPNVNLAMALRCRHLWDERQRCWRPALDEWNRSSQPWLWIAGDEAGIAGAVSARLSGAIAALDIARDLGAIDERERNRAGTPLRAALGRDRAVRPFLETLYRPSDVFVVPQADDVIICRCEEVTRGEIARVVKEGAAGPNQAKGFLRCGMGPCQGRMCGHTVTETMSALSGKGQEEIGYFRQRMPIKPITTGEIAASAPFDGAGA
ncbi:NAD(P)/FAD-dependent oxidoreductase [Bosea sp. UNC402CLCol]|uniref:FAD/NAD(P)-dependent oxidoreductase n=1 Tax=Bosea sp. UNC402CLCol TaxID=1510531 RepID=UPI0005708A78|nr:NAD(P)/FAD-dependent oxidoreductase [Bosea sp. UNC402CLCol]